MFLFNTTFYLCRLNAFCLWYFIYFLGFCGFSFYATKYVAYSQAAVEKLSFHLAVSSLSRRDLHFKAPATPTHLAKRKKQLQSCSCEQQESR